MREGIQVRMFPLFPVILLDRDIHTEVVEIGTKDPGPKKALMSALTTCPERGTLRRISPERTNWSLKISIGCATDTGPRVCLGLDASCKHTARAANEARR